GASAARSDLTFLPLERGVGRPGERAGAVSRPRVLPAPPREHVSADSPTSSLVLHGILGLPSKAESRADQPARSVGNPLSVALPVRSGRTAKLASQNFWSELIALRDRQREQRKSAVQVVRLSELPLESNEQGLMRWYLHPAITDTVLSTLAI